MLGDQGQGAGTGRQLPRWSGQPERGGKPPLPHRLAIKGRRPAARLPLQLSTPGKCTSHLGFGLVTGVILLTESIMGESDLTTGLRNLTLVAMVGFVSNLLLSGTLFARAIHLSQPQQWRNLIRVSMAPRNWATGAPETCTTCPMTGGRRQVE